MTNNVVVTSSCWGIFYGSRHGGRIVNNTVVDDGADAGTKNPAGKVVCRPAITVADKTHQGSSSNGVIIRNNIASHLAIYNLDPNMTMDHNICLGINGKCQIVTYVDGKPDFNILRPGSYGDHNIVDRRGAKSMFVIRSRQVHLRPPAETRGAGDWSRQS